MRLDDNETLSVQQSYFLYPNNLVKRYNEMTSIKLELIRKESNQRYI